VLYLQRELTAAQEMRDQQIADLQRQTEENVLSKQAVLDKKVLIFNLASFKLPHALIEQGTASSCIYFFAK
jgi:uncharacterized protein YdgA (DUF945 family)